MSPERLEGRFVAGQSAPFGGVLEDVGHGLEPKGRSGGAQG